MPTATVKAPPPMREAATSRGSTALYLRSQVSLPRSAPRPKTCCGSALPRWSVLLAIREDRSTALKGEDPWQASRMRCANPRTTRSSCSSRRRTSPGGSPGRTDRLCCYIPGIVAGRPVLLWRWIDEEGDETGESNANQNPFFCYYKVFCCSNPSLPSLPRVQSPMTRT